MPAPRYGRQGAYPTCERMSRRRGRGRAAQDAIRAGEMPMYAQRKGTLRARQCLDSEADGQANGTKDPPPRQDDLSCDPNWRRGVRRGGQYPDKPSGHHQHVRHQTRRRGMDRRAPAPSTVRRHAAPLVSQVGSQRDQASSQGVSRRAREWSTRFGQGLRVTKAKSTVSGLSALRGRERIRGMAS